MIVILPGAGIPAESGLGTFRDVDGLWTKYDLNDVATPEGFARDPALVHAFYNARRANCLGAVPNAAHEALARLEAARPGAVRIVTQNIDDLHERAGSQAVWHMHGEILRAKCQDCGHRWVAAVETAPQDPCPACQQPATRPDVVWFGEVPYFLNAIDDVMQSAELFVSIGTSGNVYPAAGFVQMARQLGVETLELNLEPSDGAAQFDAARNGPASEIVPQWVDEMLGGA